METYIEEMPGLKARKVTMNLTDESPRITKVVLFLTEHGRGNVQIHVRAGHPLTFPIPWKEGDLWADGLVREAAEKPEGEVDG